MRANGEMRQGERDTKYTHKRSEKYGSIFVKYTVQSDIGSTNSLR